MRLDKGFAPALLRWYRRNRRDLPWRADDGAGTSPYAVLVSELMLQQTQVATVIPYFQRFMAIFPTVADLAAAPEQEVLRAWQGLGYYSRARNLQSAARQITSEFEGQIPSDVNKLLTLAGIGRYTAGAVASIAFGKRVPIVDGNVARVLCRLERIESDPRLPETRKLLWDRAQEILPTRRLGQFNSALMELGATICIPRAPKCLLCPVRQFCKAAAAGVQDCIPRSQKGRPTPLFRRWTLCLRHQDRWLIEQRPAKGRWAGMWQFITIEAAKKHPTPELVLQHVGCRSAKPKQIGQLKHALTHRRYEFDVFVAQVEKDEISDSNRIRHWARLDELNAYPLPRPHLRIAEMLIEST
jgi:A/G-specific adenine glycosylase